MTWREWWKAIREIFTTPTPPPRVSEPKCENGDYHPPKPTDVYIPPHSHPEDHPEWPHKDKRQ